MLLFYNVDTCVHVYRWKCVYLHLYWTFNSHLCKRQEFMRKVQKNYEDRDYINETTVGYSRFQVRGR